MPQAPTTPNDSLHLPNLTISGFGGSITLPFRGSGA